MRAAIVVQVDGTRCAAAASGAAAARRGAALGAVALAASRAARIERVAARVPPAVRAAAERFPDAGHDVVDLGQRVELNDAAPLSIPF